MAIKKERNLNWLIEPSRILWYWGVLGILSVCPAGAVILSFDSPSPNWIANYLFICSAISFPIVCIGSSIGILFLQNKYGKLAFYVSLLPVLSLILIFVGSTWMNLTAQKETEVNIAECEFDGADGLHTTLCERARKIDNLDDRGYLQQTTSSTLEAHNWQFSAQQGNQITIRMSTWGRGCPAIRMRILDSLGIVIESFDHPAPIACTNNTHTVSMHFFDPPADGMYTLRVDTPKTPGPYWFQIMEVKMLCCKDKVT